MKPYKSSQTRRMPDNSAIALAKQPGGPASQYSMGSSAAGGVSLTNKQRDASQTSQKSAAAGEGYSNTMDSYLNK